MSDVEVGEILYIVDGGYPWGMTFVATKVDGEYVEGTYRGNWPLMGQMCPSPWVRLTCLSRTRSGPPLLARGAYECGAYYGEGGCDKPTIGQFVTVRKAVRSLDGTVNRDPESVEPVEWSICATHAASIRASGLVDNVSKGILVESLGRRVMTP